MQKEIIEIDKVRGIFRVTTPDSRWYTLPGKNKETGLPEYQYVPSVTWITNYVYKGVAYYRWLAEKKNWDEAEAIKSEAGDKGSRIHSAIEQLISGASVKMDDKFYSKNSEQDEELKSEEYAAIMSFKKWCDEVKPEFLKSELTVISKKYNFAGTVDCVAKIGDKTYIIDWKSSQYVWPSMEAQLSAYKQAVNEDREKPFPFALAILQIGYRKNKKGFKFTEVEDQFESLFIPAQKFWEKENLGKSPRQAEYPLSISLNLDLRGPSVVPSVTESTIPLKPTPEVQKSAPAVTSAVKKSKKLTNK